MSRYQQGGYYNNRNSNYTSGGGRRGGRHGGGGREPPWYETVKTDRNAQERPKWNLTSYGHVREQENDIRGDISPEEVRYANMISMHQGVTKHALGDEFRKANRQRVDVFQGLTRRRQAPSIEGNPIVAPMDTIQNMTWLQSSASSSGSGVGGFGSSATAQNVSQAFGTTRANFGSNSTAMMIQQPGGGGGGFGSGSIGGAGFGGTFGSNSSTKHFGSLQQQPQQQQQQQQTGFGSFNQQQQTVTNQPTGGFHGVFGQQPSILPTQQTKPTFGNQQVQQAFGQTSSSPFGIEQQQQQATSPQVQISPEESRVWMTESFERGSIPTIPPPPHVCQ